MPVNSATSSRNLLRDLKGPMLTVLLARTVLAGVGIALYAAGRIPMTADPTLRPYFGQSPVTEGLAGSLLGVWQRFDAIHYLRIASEGYSATDLSVYFPFFPLLVRAVGRLFGLDYLFASLLISTVALILAAITLHRLVMEEWRDPGLAGRAVTYLVFFPTAFFLLAPYTESLALLFSLVAFRQARLGRWWTAGLAGVACALTRSQGVLISAVFLIEAARQRPRGVRAALPRAFAILAPALGLLSFLAWRSSVSFPAISEVLLDYWQRVATVPFSVILVTVGRMATGEAGFIEYIDLLVVAIMLGVGLLMVKRLPFTYVAFFWILLLFNLSQTRLTQPISSQARYALSLFPAFIVLAQLGSSPRANRLILYTSLALWLFLAGQFMMWGWVG